MGLVHSITLVHHTTYTIKFHQYRPQLPDKTAAGTLTIDFPLGFDCGRVVTGDAVGLELYSVGELVALEPIENTHYQYLLREANVPAHTYGDKALAHQYRY